jgi:glycosyltransferase involved in cell wall biosynthesis
LIYYSKARGKALKIAHLSSHHERQDNRIFFRECCTLAQAGHDVSLVIANDRDEVIDGVKILGITKGKSRWERVTFTAAKVAWRGYMSGADVLHFHDPELIPWGFVLRALGKKVVFDVHEDFAQAAGVREWIPGPLRKLVAGGYATVAAWADKAFEIVIAERYYERSFPGATPVLNYPHLSRSERLRSVDREATWPDRIRLLYAGTASESRGALLQVALAQHLPGCLIHFSGRIPKDLAPRMIEAAGDVDVGLMAKDGSIEWVKRSTKPEPSQVILQGVDYFVGPEMVEAFCEPWTAGLAIFPLNEHYYEKELTKFFEYMAAGLPMVVSDFPVWRAIIDADECGFCVAPDDIAAAAEKIRWLHENRDAAIAMGARGRRAVETKYSWASQQKNLIDLYARLTGQSSAAHG